MVILIGYVILTFGISLMRRQLIPVKGFLQIDCISFIIGRKEIGVANVTLRLKITGKGCFFFLPHRFFHDSLLSILFLIVRTQAILVNIGGFDSFIYAKIKKSNFFFLSY